jgi:hypothetical protein
MPITGRIASGDRYAADTVAGETNGQGAEGVWFVLDPTGTAIDAG